MTEVVVTPSKGSDFIWSDAVFNWDSPNCEKSWENFCLFNYNALVQESLDFNQEVESKKGRFFNESFKISGKVSSVIHKSIEESITIGSRVSRVTNFIKHIEEFMHISSSQKKEIEKTFEKSFKIYDDWVRNANAVYSDLVILDNPMDESTFVTELLRGSPVGMTNFTTYIPGYYEFESALFRMVLRGTGLDRIRLKYLNMVVDVPDVFDRGDNIINEGAYTTINFNRNYIKPPNVIAVQSGGEISQVSIKNITKLSFDAALINGPNMVAGAITWISEGY